MYDLVINNGTIVDGFSENKFIGSVGVIGNKINKISEKPLEGKKVIDAEGLIVTPGFIDLHTHSDTGLVLDNRSENKLFQGVTTDIVGNCGVSLFLNPKNSQYAHEFKNYSSNLLIGLDKVKSKFDNLNDFYEVLLSKKIAINCGALVGHGNLRICAMGFSDSIANIEQIDTMKDLLDEELESGALGMSLGLIYPPGSFADKNELIELAKVLKKHDAVLTAHIRNENDKVIDAIEEIIDIAKATGVRAHISHIKLMGKSNWGKGPILMNMINEANDSGLKITCDQYPYEATSTTLTAIIPGWVQEGGVSKMLERLQYNKEEILPQIDELILKRGGPDKIKVAYTFGIKKEYEGKFISKISEILNLTPAEAVADILIQCKGKINAIYFSMSDKDIDFFLKNNEIAVASDGFSFDFENRIGGGIPHPRSFGTFPRFIRLSREKNLLSIEETVKKITSLPAGMFKLKNMGKIKEGYFADITIFDWNKFTDTATFDNPFQKPLGLNYVIISGKVTLSNGNISSDREGRIIKLQRTDII